MATVTTVLVYTQIVVGAAMRHSGAGLAIPDFPLMFGGLLPDRWSTAIGVHFAHRVGALVVTLAVIATATHIWRHHAQRQEFSRPVKLLLLLLAVQVTLGALTVLTRRAVWINSAHVVFGALVLTTSLVIALRSWRSSFADAQGRLSLHSDERQIGAEAPGTAPSVGAHA